MDVKEIIIDIIYSKQFISIFSFLFGIFVYKFYLYIQKLKAKHEYSNTFRDFYDYAKKGILKQNEYIKLIKLLKNISDSISVCKVPIEEYIEKYKNKKNN